MTGATGTAGHDPWQRLGWLLWAPWMLFMVFPLTASWSAEGDVRWLATAATLGFAVAYAVLMSRMTRGATTAWGPVPEGVAGIGVLVALAAATAPAIGLSALGFAPFLQAFAVFSLPLPRAWWFSGTLFAGVAALVLSTESFAEWGYFLFILFAVTVGAGVGRFMEEQSGRYAEVRDRLTVSAERERVARDVHDVLGHSLTVVTVKADLAARLVDVDPDRARAEMEDVQRLSRQALAEIRATVGGLRAAPLADEVEAARSALEGAGIEPVLPADVQAVDPRYRAVVGWVLREAVTNVVRHSGAHRCEVSWEADRLAVLDDGRGMGGSPEGNGLRGLRERIEGSGGRLLLTPGPGGVGTRLEATW